MFKKNFQCAVILLAVIGVTNSQLYAIDEIYTSSFSSTAVEGYDVVSYFDSGEPKKGNTEFSTTYKKATWLFSTQENLEKFKVNPGQYAPQFGGHCAWAASEGYIAKGDPNYWEVYEGKLYLNYNASIKQKWSVEKSRHISKGNKNWPNILTQ